MSVPKNCSVCAYSGICHAPHYGGSRCRYEKQINQRTVQALLETSSRREEKK